MKKIVSGLFIVGLLLIGFTGCSNHQVAPQIEEEESSHLISSKPYGAKVFCTSNFSSIKSIGKDANELSDGFLSKNFKECGTTRLELFPGKSAVYLLTKEGYKNKFVEIIGEDGYETVTLEEIKGTAYLKLFSNQRNTKIYVNDKYIGVIDSAPNTNLVSSEGL